VLFQRGTADATGFDQVSGDVRDPSAVDAAVAGCDAVVHLAAKVGVVGRWEEYRATNVEGTEHVLAAAARHGVTKVVHVSSPSVAHGGEPITGAGADPVVLGRRGAFYAESKALAEQVALAAATDHLGVVAIRPHLVWGPGDTQLVGRILERARTGRLAIVGDGAALVDTTYIDNAADALVAALDAVAPGVTCSGRAYVVANGEPRPIGELVVAICRAGGLDVEPRRVPAPVGLVAGSVVERLWSAARRTDEPPLTRFLAEQLGTAHWFDPRPARRDLGWTPVVSVDEGLARLADWIAAGGFPGERP
jgi:nucleoside-diphosphate-sugar epimerase